MDISSLARFQIAPGFDPALPGTWMWEDRSQDVDHVDGGITISSGRADEISDVDTGYCSLRVDNAGGHYCTENPLGRWYGKLRRNTPARWGVISGRATFGTTASNGLGVPDLPDTSWALEGAASAWSVSGGVGQRAFTSSGSVAAELLGADARDGEAVITFITPVIATGAAFTHSILARRAGPQSTLLFSLDFGLSGALTARIRRDNGGVLTTLASAGAGTYTAGQRIKVRAQWDGQDLRMQVGPESGFAATSWTVVATDAECPGAGVGFHLARAGGNTNAGTVTIGVDNFEVLDVEAVGTIPAFPVRWDPTATTSWAPIQIAGVTRRMSQGAQALHSPIYRQLVAQAKTGYWPLEDGSDAGQAASALTRGRAGVIADATFGDSDSPPGAASALKLNTVAASRVTGQVAAWTVPQDGYAVMWYSRLPSLVVGATHLRHAEIAASGRVTRWVIGIANASLNLTGLDSDGATVVSTGAIATTPTNLTQWTAFQLECVESGGTTNWTLIWHQVGSTVFYNVAGSYSGSADRVGTATLFAPVDGTLVSHLWIGDDSLPFVDTTFQLVSAGYAGELASARIKRLCREEGIPVAVENGDSEPLGVQRIATLMDLLRAAEAADMGVLYEAGASLGYKPRGARFNPPVWMALAIGPGGDIGDEPEPTTDDQRVRNSWTVARDGGSDSTYEDAEHIAAEGRYPDSATINIQGDDRLQYHAQWRVHLGTWGEMRWPQITVVLTDRPVQLARWRGRPFGARITVSGVPSQGPVGADLDLIVEGYTQEIRSDGWRVTLACSPARPWDIGVWDAGRKWNSSSTTTGSTLPAATGSASLTLTTQRLADLWHTASTGYRIVAAGEEMTVTFMGSPSGTGPWTQVATVTRAANGISKAHVVGERVQVAESYRFRFGF